MSENEDYNRKIEIITLLKLLHHGSDKIRTILLEQFLQMAHTLGMVDSLALHSVEGCSQLLIKLGTVCDKDQLVFLQLWITPHLHREKHHRQGLTRSLRMPNHPTPVFTALASLDAFNRLVNSSELLVPG